MVAQALALLSSLINLSAPLMAEEPQLVFLKSPTIKCIPEHSNEADVVGFAYPFLLGGTKKDKCVKISPTDRGDTHLVHVGENEKSLRLVGKIFSHSRSIQVSKKMSASMALFDKEKNLTYSEELPSDMYFEISESGLKILALVPTYNKDRKSLYRADMAVAFWDPKAVVK